MFKFLEYYLQLIDSFKQIQLSSYIKDIREKMISFLESEHFAPKAKPFFDDIPGCRFLFVSAFSLSIENNIQQAYILSTDKRFYYFNRTHQPQFKEFAILPEEYEGL